MRPLASAPCSRCGATAGGDQSLCPACLLRLASLPQSRVPQYEVETLLGAHDGATTYLARAAGTGALLAVKAFDTVVTDPETLDRLEALGDRLASLRHPGVARTRGIEVDGDRARLVRDYAGGRPFDLWRRQATAQQVEGAIAAIRDALGAIHQQDLAHGHLVPANIVVSDGRPVLIDAGAQLVGAILAGGQPRVLQLKDDDLSRLARLI